MKRIFLIFPSLTLVLSCGNNSKIIDKNSSDMVFRLHTPKMETDWYEDKGNISLGEFLEYFHSINWEDVYWEENNNGTFNPYSLETLSEESKKYIGVTVCPYTPETFQFQVCYGKHNVKSDSAVERMVKIYMTSSDDMEIIDNLFNLFFAVDYKNLESRLDKLDFFDEIEDVYLNINND